MIAGAFVVSNGHMCDGGRGLSLTHTARARSIPKLIQGNERHRVRFSDASEGNANAAAGAGETTNLTERRQQLRRRMSRR